MENHHLALGLLEYQVHVLPDRVVNPLLPLGFLQEQEQVLPSGVVNTHLAVDVL